MSKVSIIGIGDVGSTLAYTLQLSGLATEIVLVDVRCEVAEGHALDMNHGLFFTPPARIRAGDYPDCEGSRVVIVTAGARQKPDETRLALTRRNAELCAAIVKSLGPWLGNACLLLVNNPVDLMTGVARRVSGLPEGRVFGSGTVLDSSRFRYELSRHCGVDPRNVHAYVIGEHGDSEVFLWSRVHIAGVPLADFCSGCARGCGVPVRAAIEETVRTSAYHVIEAKGYTNYGVSLAVLRILGALLRDEKSVLTVSTLLRGEYGIRDVCLSVPCVVGAGGVERVVELTLAAAEQEGLRRSAGVLASSALVGAVA